MKSNISYIREILWRRSLFHLNEFLLSRFVSHLVIGVYDQLRYIYLLVTNRRSRVLHVIRLLQFISQLNIDNSRYIILNGLDNAMLILHVCFL